MHRRLFFYRLVSAIITVFFSMTGFALSLNNIDDDTIVTQLPKTITLITNETDLLRRQLKQQPNNIDIATALAKRYIQTAQNQSDPRFLGYAQGVLSPWWHTDKPPVDVRILRATIYQNQHRFNEALIDLDAAIKAEPTRQQAWLLKATVHQSLGQHPQAIGSCYQLGQYATSLISSGCMAASLYESGLAGRAMGLLDALAQENINQQTPEIQQWLYTLFAETSAQLNQARAETFFRQALGVKKRSPHLLLSYSDYLLKQQLPQNVIALLAKDDTLDDTLLLQLARSYRAMGDIENTEKYKFLLSQRFKTAESQNSLLHQASAARFALEFEDDKQKALTLAKNNWKQQKTYRDKKLLKDIVATMSKNASTSLR